MSKMLEGRAAAVTGSGRGLGRAIVSVLAEQGAKVVVNDLGTSLDGRGEDNSPADEVVAEIKKEGGTAVANYNDVATMKGAQGMIQSALDAFGRIDILVNNAGIVRDASIVDMTEEDWDAVIRVHLKGMFACTKAAYPHMVAQKYGRILNVSSRGAFGLSIVREVSEGAPAPSPDFGKHTNYAAAKAGVLGFTRELAPYSAQFGITCNSIIPTANTRMMQYGRDMLSAVDPKLVTEEMKTGMDPRETAYLAAYLASEQGAIANGRTIWAARGRMILYSNPQPLRTLFKKGGFPPEDMAEVIPQELLGNW